MVVNRMLVEIWMIKVIHSVEVSGRNEEHVFGNWRKGSLSYKVAKSLAEQCSCPGVLWKVEIVSHEKQIFGFKEIPKQNVEGAAWFLLNAYNKIQKERNDLRQNC